LIYASHTKRERARKWREIIRKGRRERGKRGIDPQKEGDEVGKRESESKSESTNARVGKKDGVA